MHKKIGKTGFIMFKIDFEKAYDRVDWSFLRKTLCEFGFPTKIVDLIMNCTTEEDFLYPFFSSRHDHRQGDPMSLYLFLFCMEKQGLLIQDKVSDGHWQLVSISRNGSKISHFYFVNDCLLFTKAIVSQVKLVQDVLRGFFLAYGLKVNVHKSNFFASKNVSRSQIQKFVYILNFQRTHHPSKYLGFPLITSKTKKAYFAFLLDRVNSRIIGWKSKLLNCAGRVTLANSVLPAIPFYMMQNLWIPQGICDTIDSRIRCFIWGGNHNHWVDWGTISKSRQHGGLSVHKCKQVNIALLGKHVQVLMQDLNKLWVKILNEKYVHNSNVCNLNVSKGCSYSWSSIMKGLSTLRSGFYIQIRDGSSSLWFKPWLYGDTLYSGVEDIHERDLHLRVCDVYFDGELHLDVLTTSILGHIWDKLLVLFLDYTMPDTITWSHSSSGEYDTKSAYVWLNHEPAGHFNST